MKRKDAIRKIAQKLNASFKDLNIGDSEAKALLDWIEEDLGMNPPYNSYVDDEEDGCFWESDT